MVRVHPVEVLAGDERLDTGIDGAIAALCTQTGDLLWVEVTMTGTRS